MRDYITAIVIDDESRARSLLRDMLLDCCPEVRVLADCPDLPSGVKAIHKFKPQLVFLDIEMPGHSGLELLDFFDADEVGFSVIFTTAYHEYAIQAFKLSAVDYLLKPIGTNDLVAAVALYKRRNGQSNLPNVSLMAQSSNSAKIAVPSGSAVKFIDKQAIVYLKADSSYTEVMLADGSHVVVSRTLKNFEDALQGDAQFFRCQKSYLVNLHCVTEYKKSDGGTLLLNGKHEVPISPDKVQEFLDKVHFIKR
jgi:two-component system LytT family response regulator